MDITSEQRDAITAFVKHAITPLLEKVIVKKLGQSAIFIRDELQKEHHAELDRLRTLCAAQAARIAELESQAGIVVYDNKASLCREVYQSGKLISSEWCHNGYFTIDPDWGTFPDHPANAGKPEKMPSRLPRVEQLWRRIEEQAERIKAMEAAQEWRAMPAPNGVPIVVLYDNGSLEFFDADSNNCRWQAYRKQRFVNVPMLWVPTPPLPKEST